MGWVGFVLQNILSEQRKQSAKLDKILNILRAPEVVGFTVTEEVIQTGEHLMAKVKATVALQITPGGQTVEFVATPVDAAGNPDALPAGTPALTYTSSDPAMTVAVDPADTSGFGLSFIGTPTGTPATGIVVSCSTTLSNGTVISASADPLDVVAAPNLPTGFTIVESVNNPASVQSKRR
jgi:hypothetical protein